MPIMEFISSLFRFILNFLGVVFLAWVVFYFRTEIRELLKAIGEAIHRAQRVEIGKLLKIYFEALEKTLKRGLASEDPEERAKVIDRDVSKIGSLLSSPVKIGMSTIESGAERKFLMICEKLTDLHDGIDDYVFVSGTYGYDVWPTEMDVMMQRGWIRVADGKIFMTEKGRKYCQANKNKRTSGDVIRNDFEIDPSLPVAYDEAQTEENVDGNDDSGLDPGDSP